MTFDDVIGHYGSQVAVSRALDCSKAYISKWNKDGYVPRGRQFEIEKMSRGELKVGEPFTREPECA